MGKTEQDFSVELLLLDDQLPGKRPIALNAFPEQASAPIQRGPQQECHDHGEQRASPLCGWQERIQPTPGLLWSHGLFAHGQGAKHLRDSEQ